MSLYLVVRRAFQMRRAAKVFAVITSIALLAAPLMACDGGGESGGAGDPSVTSS